MAFPELAKPAATPGSVTASGRHRPHLAAQRRSPSRLISGFGVVVGLGIR